MKSYAIVTALILAMAVMLIAQAPTPATVSELERLKLVNAWQKAIIANVDKQTADQRMALAKDSFMQQQVDIRQAHKWPDATTFDINNDTGAVTVHLPPAKPSPNSSQPPASGTKENH